MVVDTSALLAVFFDEPHGAWAAEVMEDHASELKMSTVNLTEALIHLRDRQPRLFDELEERLLGSGIKFVPPDTVQARLAAEARLEFPINLGDCFALALARVEDCPILTLDNGFARTGHPLVTP